MEYPVPACDFLLGQPRVMQGPSAAAFLRVIVFADFAIASKLAIVPYDAFPKFPCPRFIFLDAWFMYVVPTGLVVLYGTCV